MRSIVAIALLAGGCADTATAPSVEESVVQDDPDDGLLSVLSTEIVLPEFDHLETADREALSLNLARLEHGLALIPGVVPRLQGGEPPPGLGESLEVRTTYTVHLRIGSKETALDLCLDDDCQTFTASGRGAVDALSSDVAVALGRSYEPGHIDRTDDDYARKMLGRAAAVWTGMREPSVRPGDRRRDPVARAGFLDPSLVTAQWGIARSDWARAKQTLAYLRRSANEKNVAVHLAGEAWALEKIGSYKLAAERWERVVALAPEDPRFVLPAARAALLAERPEVAELALARLPNGDAQVVAFQVEIADRNHGGASDTLLAAWQDVDESNPEPVRRRIALRLLDGDLRGAGAFADSLALRGASSEADALTHAVRVNLGEENSGELDLAGTDALLASLGETLSRARTTGNELAEVQNNWANQVFAVGRGRCSAVTRDLRATARSLGATQRNQLERARLVARDLQAALESPAVGPVLDADRKKRATALHRDLQAAMGAYLAGVEFQSMHVERGSSQCG